MGLKAGIVGLPNVGKSTLFSGLTKMEVEASNYAFTTISPNISIVEVKDLRIDLLAEMVKTKKKVRATFEFVDIAGLVKGASKGEGLGNQFLSNIKEVDLIVHVIRCFEDQDILHVHNKIDPVEDYKTIMLELILADLQILTNVKKRIEKKALNTNDQKIKKEYELVQKLINLLEQEKPLRDFSFSEEETKIVKSYQLLSQKEMIILANISSSNAACPKNERFYQELADFAIQINTKIIALSVAIESEIALLNDEDKKIFLTEYNLEQSGIDNLIFQVLKELNLSTFFTVGQSETRAWIFKNGSFAPECAGIIHSDFEKNFIKAEIISYQDYVDLGGEKEAKERGKLRLEGKNYIMQDGDIVYFRFAKN